MRTQPPRSARPRIRPGRRMALLAASGLAAGSIVLSSGVMAQAQTLEPTPSDEHTTAPPTPSPSTPTPTPTHSTTSPSPSTPTPTHTTASPTPPPGPSTPMPSTPPSPPTSSIPTTPEQPSVLGESTGPTCATQTVVSGDTLWDLAGRYLGDSTRWAELYDANQSVIEAAARSHGHASSNHGSLIFPGSNVTVPSAACVTPTPQATSLTPPGAM